MLADAINFTGKFVNWANEGGQLLKSFFENSAVGWNQKNNCTAFTSAECKPPLKKFEIKSTYAFGTTQVRKTSKQPNEKV